MKPSSLTHLSKVVITAVSVVALSPISSTLAATELSNKIESKPDHSTQQQFLADKTTSEKVETNSTTEIRRETVTTERRTQTTGYMQAKKSSFTLAVLQPQGNVSEVVTRVSIKRKHGKKYHKERFLGDYKYKIKQKAKFEKGFKAGDRIVVRLFDTANRFIGYSEFDCLPGNTVVNLVLSGKPTEYKVVRTFYGFDANNDGIVDTNSTTYDYFTQVSEQKVSFLRSSQNISVAQYQAAGFSQVVKTSAYPASFTTGEYAVVNRSMNVFSSDLAKALTVVPGSLVELTEVSDDSSYELGELLSTYRQIGVAKGIQVSFADVAQNYWAKDFIAELAAMEVIEGFPDGSFRPDAPVTRAQFAAMLQKVFSKNKVRNAIAFRDVSSRYWAYNAIRETYQMGFLNTVATREFNPTQSLSRLEILVTLARALNYQATGSTANILSVYNDASSISSEYRTLIASLTQRGVVVNYPDVSSLNAEQIATRAEVCALLYKSLVSTGEVTDISSRYAVQQTQMKQQTEMNEMETEKRKPQSEMMEMETDDKKRNCNQGIGNGAEGCDPGNSRPRGGSNDEGGRTPGGKK